MKFQQGEASVRARNARYGLLVLSWLVVAGALAQESAPEVDDLATVAAKRFPQPVRVGTLIDRPVLEPVESRRILGHLDQVIRLKNGNLAIVMSFGGFLGFGTHKIAVPIDAIALLGSELEVLGYTPEQLGAFPTYDGTGTGLGTEEIIQVGLGHPSH